MKAYSKDLRERIVEACEQAESHQSVAKRFKVSRRTVDRYWKSYKERGSFECGKMGGHRRRRFNQQDGTLKGWIKEQGDLTLEQLQQRACQQLNIQMSISGLCRHLKRIGLSYKKNVTGCRTRSR